MKKICKCLSVLLTLITASFVFAQTALLTNSKTAQTTTPLVFENDQHNLLNPTLWIEPQIVGGTLAPYGKYPEFAAIFEWREATDDQIAGYYLFCGGTLIAEDKVLTAAHCVHDLGTSNLYVIPGFYSVFPINNIMLTSEDFIQVSQIDTHPQFSLNTINNAAKFDVAVLMMEKESDAPFSILYAGTQQFADDKGTVIGMGTVGENSQTPVPTLRQVSIPIVSNAVCSDAYSNYGNIITAEMICAGLSKGGQGTCIGDSGGPLWTNHNGKRIQVGIVSFSRGCARADSYGVYARVSELIDFIREHASVITLIDAVPTSVISELLLSD